MNCGIASIPTLRPWLTLEVPSFEHVLIENNLSDKHRKMHIYLLRKIDWLKNFLNFHNSGRQTKLKINQNDFEQPFYDGWFGKWR